MFDSPIILFVLNSSQVGAQQKLAEWAGTKRIHKAGGKFSTPFSYPLSHFIRVGKTDELILKVARLSKKAIRSDGLPADCKPLSCLREKKNFRGKLADKLSKIAAEEAETAERSIFDMAKAGMFGDVLIRARGRKDRCELRKLHKKQWTILRYFSNPKNRATMDQIKELISLDRQQLFIRCEISDVYRKPISFIDVKNI